MLDKCHKGERGAQQRGGNLLKEGKTMVLALKYGKRNPPFHAFNLIYISNGEETTIVGPFPLTLAHRANQGEKEALHRVEKSRLVTYFLEGPPLGVKFVFGT